MTSSYRFLLLLFRLCLYVSRFYIVLTGNSLGEEHLMVLGVSLFEILLVPWYLFLGTTFHPCSREEKNRIRREANKERRAGFFGVTSLEVIMWWVIGTVQPSNFAALGVTLSYHPLVALCTSGMSEGPLRSLLLEEMPYLS